MQKKKEFIAKKVNITTKICMELWKHKHQAGIAQLGERQTEDLKVTCSIHVHRILFIFDLHAGSFKSTHNHIILFNIHAFMMSALYIIEIYHACTS
jgi:hypothetical protein